MRDFPNEENFISLIHNYCDRWCERCEFTARCRVFAQESATSLEYSDDPVGDAVRTVAAALADATRMLAEKAGEMGIDLAAVANDPEIIAGMERQQVAVDDQEAVELAKNYALESRDVLDATEAWLSAREDPMALEMLEIIQWYLFFIAAKVRRGYDGIIDLDGDKELDQLEDMQSDANGSIKVALIAIERSVLSWTYLLDEMNTSTIHPVIERLERIKSLIEAKFPNAREFVRPGFDEIEAVM